MKKKNKPKTFHTDTRTCKQFSQTTGSSISSQVWGFMELLYVCLYVGQKHFSFNLNHCFPREKKSLGNHLFLIIMRTFSKEKPLNVKDKILCASSSG